MLIKNDFIARYRKIEEEKIFKSIVDIKKSDVVLELGCGSGRWSFFLADKCKFVTAVDFSRNMIKLATSIQNEKGIKNIKFICKEAENYLDSNRYNIIYLSGFLQYLNDDDVIKLLGNLKKMFNEKTLLISRDTVSLTGNRIIKNGDYQVIYRTIDEYKAIFSKFNLNLTKKQESYIAPFLSCKFGLDKIIYFKIVYFFEALIIKKVSCLKLLFDDVFRKRKVKHCFFVYGVKY